MCCNLVPVNSSVTGFLTPGAIRHGILASTNFHYVATIVRLPKTVLKNATNCLPLKNIKMDVCKTDLGIVQIIYNVS